MHIKANFQLDKMSVHSSLSLRTLSYGQFVHSFFCSRSSFLDELARNRLLHRLLYTWLELPVTLKQGKNINKTIYSANDVKVKRLSKF